MKRKGEQMRIQIIVDFNVFFYSSRSVHLLLFSFVLNFSFGILRRIYTRISKLNMSFQMPRHFMCSSKQNILANRFSSSYSFSIFFFFVRRLFIFVCMSTIRKMYIFASYLIVMCRVLYIWLSFRLGTGFSISSIYFFFDSFQFLLLSSSKQA